MRPLSGSLATFNKIYRLKSGDKVFVTNDGFLEDGIAKVSCSEGHTVILCGVSKQTKRETEYWYPCTSGGKFVRIK